MKHEDAFPSKYLSKKDVDPAITATIRDVYQEKIKGDGGDETKVIMSFREDLKPLIVNNTNWTTCEDAYGTDSDGWIGKKLEIYYDPTIMFGGKRVGGVRVRIPLKAAHDAASDMSLEQALAELAKVGMGKDELRQIVPEINGKRSYSPSRDSDAVRELILNNTQPAEEVAL